MGEPKIKLSELGKLLTDGKDKNLQDKKLIEALCKRLNEKLQDPKMAKKAALILESWIHKKSK